MVRLPVDFSLIGNIMNATTKWVLALAVLAVALGIVNMGMLASLVHWINRPATTTAKGAYCDSNQECVVDVSVRADTGVTYCVRYPAATNTACTEAAACYVADTPLTCDGNGTCSNPDPTTCLGYCPYNETGGAVFYETQNGAHYTEACNAGLFPFQPYWSDPINKGDTLIVSSVSEHEGPACIAQQCTFSGIQLQLEVENTTSAIWAFSTPLTPSCDAMLDWTNETVTSGCIQSQELRLDSAFLVHYFDIFLPGSLAGAAGRVCTYWYGCATQNATNYYDPMNLGSKKRGLSDGSEVARDVLPRLLERVRPRVEEYVKRKTHG